MKKKRLVLHRETLRLLSAPVLTAIRGAEPSVDPGGCTIDWGCTGGSRDCSNGCFPETHTCPGTTNYGQTVCTPCEM